MGKRGPEERGNPRKKMKKCDIIDPSWKGVFVTCPRGRESKAKHEALDWLSEAAEELWPQSEGENEDDADKKELSIEEQIKLEVEDLAKSNKQKGSTALIAYDNLGCECVVFIRTKGKIVPSQLVRKVCENACADSSRGVKFVQRLSPVDALVPAIPELDNFEPVLSTIIDASFKTDPPKELKFAIKPSIRLSDKINRDGLIKAVANLVGDGHKVDLKNYDRVVLVECFKAVLGLSVANQDYEGKFCRYNLMQINQKAQEAKDGGESS